MIIKKNNVKAAPKLSRRKSLLGNCEKYLTKGESIRKKGLYYKSINLLSLLLPFLSLNKEMIKTNTIPHAIKPNDSKCFKIKK